MGRPVKDNAALVNAVLLRWDRLGRGRRMLFVAIADVAKDPPGAAEPRGGERNYRRLLHRSLRRYTDVQLESMLAGAREQLRQRGEATTPVAPALTLAEIIARQDQRAKALTRMAENLTRPARAMRELLIPVRNLAALFEAPRIRIHFRSPKRGD
jgi:hypothetical protein